MNTPMTKPNPAGDANLDVRAVKDIIAPMKAVLGKVSAACLVEQTSNPKSFFNCPDLHGGVPGLPGGSRPKGTVARSHFGRIRARQQPDPKSFGEPNFVF